MAGRDALLHLYFWARSASLAHMENNYLRQVLRWFRFRGLALVGVFLCGFIAFLMGVGVTDRAGVADADTMTKLYYTLGLFVLGGMDLGVPRGGPGDRKSVV